MLKKICIISLCSMSPLYSMRCSRALISFTQNTNIATRSIANFARSFSTEQHSHRYYKDLKGALARQALPILEANNYRWTQYNTEMSKDILQLIALLDHAAGEPPTTQEILTNEKLKQHKKNVETHARQIMRTRYINPLARNE